MSWQIYLRDVKDIKYDIKYDITSVKKELRDHSESIALMNQRLDNIEKDK